LKPLPVYKFTILNINFCKIKYIFLKKKKLQISLLLFKKKFLNDKNLLWAILIRGINIALIFRILYIRPLKTILVCSQKLNLVDFLKKKKFFFLKNFYHTYFIIFEIFSFFRLWKKTHRVVLPNFIFFLNLRELLHILG